MRRDVIVMAISSAANACLATKGAANDAFNIFLLVTRIRPPVTQMIANL